MLQSVYCRYHLFVYSVYSFDEFASNIIWQVPTRVSLRSPIIFFFC